MGSVQVELFGMARVLAGCSQLDLPADGCTTTSRALALLAERCPALVGPVLDPHGGGLTPAYLCNLNGERFLTESELKEPVMAGSHLLVLPATAGG